MEAYAFVSFLRSWRDVRCHQTVSSVCETRRSRFFEEEFPALVVEGVKTGRRPVSDVAESKAHLFYPWKDAFAP